MLYANYKKLDFISGTLLCMQTTMGDRIRTLREAKGLSQAELGELCGVAKTAVSGWECGYAENIRLPALIRLLAVLGTSIQYLVYGPEGAASSVPGTAAVLPGRRRRRKNPL